MSTTSPTSSAKNALLQFTSRKFLITLTALLGSMQTTHLDLATKIIIMVLASVYVGAETLLDKGGQARVLEVARAAIGGVTSSSPASNAASALLSTLASDLGMTPDAKAILKQAYDVVSAAAAISQPPPPTAPSPTHTVVITANDVAQLDPHVLAAAIVKAAADAKTATAPASP